MAIYGKIAKNVKKAGVGKADYQPIVKLMNGKAAVAQVFGNLESLTMKDCQFKSPLQHGGQP